MDEDWSPVDLSGSRPSTGALLDDLWKGTVPYAVFPGFLDQSECSAVVEALKCKEEGTSRNILFNLSGHGNFDMQAYTDYFAGNLMDEPYDEAALAEALATLPNVAAE